MNSPVSFAWVIGDNDAWKYRIHYHQDQDQLTLEPVNPEISNIPVVIQKFDKKWKVVSLEDWPFRILFEKRNLENPVMALSDKIIQWTILVGDYFDGRSQYYSFWIVLKITKAGNCQLQKLPTREYLVYSDPGNVIKLLVPLFNLPLQQNLEILTTTKNRKGELKIKKDTNLFLFDSEKAYLSNWLSD